MSDTNFNLPEGFTCEECYAFRFCFGIGVSKPGQTTCDWFPVRFSPSLESVRKLKQQISTINQQPST